jgi:cation:H+ antiporter
MFSSLALIIVGLAILICGGEVLLRGAVGLANFFKLTPTVIGLTVVAAGTSVPELAVSALAAMQGKTDISVGNVVGSNIFNIGFILGLVAVYRPLTLVSNTIKLEYPFLAAVTLLFFVFGLDQRIGRIDAVLFIACYVAFTWYMVHSAKSKLNIVDELHFKEEVQDLTPNKNNRYSALALPVGLTVVGIALLGWGADITVSAAVKIGEMLGMSERIIGLTIVGAGTGLPELVTSVVSARRGRNDVAIANVIGSNLFNILGILGLSAIFAPLAIAPQILSSDAIWMLALTLVLFPVMRSGLCVSRREGMLLASIYVAYLIQLIW